MWDSETPWFWETSFYKKMFENIVPPNPACNNSSPEKAPSQRDQTVDDGCVDAAIDDVKIVVLPFPFCNQQ